MAPLLKVRHKHHHHLNNPFPAAPTCLPFMNGTLSCNPAMLPQRQIFPIGEDFLLNWSSRGGGLLSISHKSQPGRSIWSTIPGEAFVSAAVVQTEAEESRGSFVIKDGEVFSVCSHQSLENIRIIGRSHLDKKGEDLEFLSGFIQSNSDDDISGQSKERRFPICLITGWVFSKKMAEKARPGHVNLGNKFCDSGGSSLAARYWVLLDQKTNYQVGFQVKFGEVVHDFGIRTSPRSAPRLLRSPRWKLIRLRRRRRFVCFPRPRGFAVLSSDEEQEDDNVGVPKEFNRVVITFSSEMDERFYGFGEQFSHMEFKGKRVPILVQEQGIGRGDQPITFAANLVSYRSGGDWSTTYAPSPFYITSKMRSMYLEGYSYSVFDLTKPDRVQVQIYGSSVQGRILHGNSPVEIIERFTETIGRPPTLPNWIISGAIVGMQGGTDAVRRVWDQLQAHDVPVSAFWLQDWVGQRKTVIGSQLWWNWELDSSQYPGWSQLVKDLRARNIKVMAYCNPCLALTDDKPNRKRNLFKEAEDLDILVKDGSGSTYMVPNTAFSVGMIDFTHPDASSWFKKILQEMVDCGVSGWMADFGEGLPLDVNLFSGEDPIPAHNRYPEIWAKVNREFVDEWKPSCHRKEKEYPEERLVFFMRAGFRDSPKWGMLFWEGDQMASWQINDGIKSSVVGLLSSGLSGFPFNHSDIGGYCAVNFPIIKYRRSEELLLRWMELSAFSTVFRTHEGNNPSSNCQFYSNHRTFAHFARFTKVYMAWKFYRVQLVKEAAEKGLPVSRHLFLHYPDDEHVHGLTYQQFLVGTEILVVPVLDKGKKKVKAYFPLGDGCPWQHVWSGKLFGESSDCDSNTQQGLEAWLDAPIGYPAVFIKHGSPVGETFVQNLRDLNLV
uniref:Alpha-glucosidase yihQ n=1 Tax=Anthurium amnicola TaxID=1678845 RepID=A0A1D1Y4N6_9ARAE